METIAEATNRWTTADYAFLVSLFSATLAFISLAWNIWSKFIYPKPRIRVDVSSAYYDKARNMLVTGLGGGEAPDLPGVDSEGKVVAIMAINHGPVDCMMISVIAKVPGDQGFGWMTTLKNWPASSEMSRSFGSQLPCRIAPGERHIEYILASKELVENTSVRSIGYMDSYGRRHFCPSSHLRNLRKVISSAPNYKELPP